MKHILCEFPSPFQEAVSLRLLKDLSTGVLVPFWAGDRKSKPVIIDDQTQSIALSNSYSHKGITTGAAIERDVCCSGQLTGGGCGGAVYSLRALSSTWPVPLRSVAPPWLPPART